MLAWPPGWSPIRAYALACSVLKAVTSAGIRCCWALRRAVSTYWMTSRAGAFGWPKAGWTEPGPMVAAAGAVPADASAQRVGT